VSGRAQPPGAVQRALAAAPDLAGVVTSTLPPGPAVADVFDLAARFADDAGTVLLASGGEHEAARRHLLAVWPWLTLAARPGGGILTIDGRATPFDGDPLPVLRAVLDRFGLPAGAGDDTPPAGLFGYLAYDLKDHLERLPRTCVDDLQLPTMLLHAPSVLLAVDRDGGGVTVTTPRRGRPGEAGLADRLVARLVAPAPAHAPAVAGRPTSSVPRAAYEQAVARIVAAIAAGDVYQVNYTQRLRAPMRGHAFALLRRLFARNPAPFFAYVQGGDHQVVSTSPERFLQRRGDRVESRPIKGTRPRGDTPEHDRALAAELQASIKDDAELSMIVDLVRNDLGRVCRPGTVEVAAHKRLESYHNVHHLVSVVTGRLEEGRDTVDLLRAAFPAGSITGCPKIRAMEIIDALEPVRRHVYCGSIGYLGFDDTCDLSVAIRTATVAGGTLTWSVGGGVVYDSDPADEYEESMHKGRTIAEACGGGDAGSGPIAWHNGRLVPLAEATVPVTDLGLSRGYGLFETMRVDGGRAPLLADHLARLDASWRELMPSDPPDLDWGAVVAAVVGANGLDGGAARVRILATRGSRTEAPWDHSLTVTAEAYVHRLAALGAPGLRLGTVPGARQTPVAAHKTLSYIHYDRAAEWARDHGHHEALILNPDGTVSEGNSTGLLLVEGRVVVRPESPAALPSVMAAAVCRLLAKWGYTVRSEPVAPERLRTADQVLATSALMGAVPVIALDGRARPAGDDLWRRVNDAIIPGWDVATTG
jgi:para-aminobenzoate synthetase component 1